MSNNWRHNADGLEDEKQREAQFCERGKKMRSVSYVGHLALDGAAVDKQSWIPFSKDFTLGALIGLGLVALFFAQYLTTAIPFYGLLILSLFAGGNFRLPAKLFIYLAAVVIYWLVVFSYGTAPHLFTHLLFYFGFLVPLVVLENYRIRVFFMTDMFLVFLCLLILLEAVLVNSPFASSLPFLPPDESSERTQFFGFYQRPMGISGNASMTACVLFFIATLRDFLQGASRISTFLMLVGATILLASGTGFALLIIYATVSGWRTLMKGDVNNIIVGLVYFLIVYLGVLMTTRAVEDLEEFNKLSIKYMELMLDYKLLALSNLFDGLTIETLLFGRQLQLGVAMTSGDVGFLIAPNAMGLLGSVLLFGVPLIYVKLIPRIAVPTFFFYISFLHYPGLLSPPGQVAFAMYIHVLAHSKSKVRNSRPSEV